MRVPAGPRAGRCRGRARGSGRRPRALWRQGRRPGTRAESQRRPCNGIMKINGFPCVPRRGAAPGSVAHGCTAGVPQGAEPCNSCSAGAAGLPERHGYGAEAVRASEAEMAANAPRRPSRSRAGPVFLQRRRILPQRGIDWPGKLNARHSVLAVSTRRRLNSEGKLGMMQNSGYFAITELPFAPGDSPPPRVLPGAGRGAGRAALRHARAEMRADAPPRQLPSARMAIFVLGVEATAGVPSRSAAGQGGARQAKEDQNGGIH